MQKAQESHMGGASGRGRQAFWPCCAHVGTSLVECRILRLAVHPALENCVCLCSPYTSPPSAQRFPENFLGVHMDVKVALLQRQHDNHDCMQTQMRDTP